MISPLSLTEKIVAFVSAEETNRLPDGRFIYDEPLVGFASAGDPLFTELKKESVVGSVHRFPEEWLPEARTVISYFLPFSQDVTASNRGPGLASEEWLIGRYQGETLNNRLRNFLVTELIAGGGRAVAPVLDKEWQADYRLFHSNWSERHVAYIAGLGTFSLNLGLITARGMAGRFGSVVTSLDFAATPRPYQAVFAYCPFLNDGSCGVCIERCPAGAISARGKDKKRCYHYLHVQDPLAALRSKYGYAGSACGKCQTAVPCERGIP